MRRDVTCGVLLLAAVAAHAMPPDAGVTPAGAPDAGPGDAGAVFVNPDAGVADAGTLSADGGEEDPEEDEPADDAEDGVEDPNDAEREEEGTAEGPADGGPVYSRDLSDEELARLWKEDLEALGSISVGFAHEGRIINGVQVPEGEHWTVVAPWGAWGVKEVVDATLLAITEVRCRHPDAPRLRINHISNKEGGYMRPHQSHQNGRDVDLAFYYRTDVQPGSRGRREDLMDLQLNWELLKALATHTDVGVVLVDKRIQKKLRDHALSIGEDRAWVDSLFLDGPTRMVKHARRHRDHFHVRFHAPRAQELGRRVQPLLAQRPEQNIAFYRVKSGDNLGYIARRHGSTINAIRRANHLRGSFIRVGQRLQVPLRGPCTRCPMPPPVVVPPRRTPPGFDAGVPNGGRCMQAGQDAGVPTEAADTAATLDAGAQDGGAADGAIPPDAGVPDASRVADSTR